MLTVIGVDYGLKRIGLAIADSQTKIATPFDTVPATADATRDARRIADFGHDHGAERFVVGLPLNMSPQTAGDDSEQTAVVRRFAAELERLSRKPVHLYDERLSTFAAEEVLTDAGVPPKRRKGLRDRIAAQKILQGWLDAAR